MARTITITLDDETCRTNFSVMLDDELDRIAAECGCRIRSRGYDYKVTKTEE